MNAWKRILEIGFIWTRDIGAAFAARSLLGATCWRAGRDGFAKTSSMPEKKEAKDALPGSSAFAERWRCAFRSATSTR